MTDEIGKSHKHSPGSLPKESNGSDSAIANLVVSAKEVEFVWNWLLHEDSLLTNRVNFFLVAESMLVAAFATLVASSNHRLLLASYAIAAAGVLFALMWWYVSKWSLRKTVWRLRALARKGIPIYDEVCSGRKTPIGAHRLMGEYLPITIALMWVALTLLV